MRSTTSSIMPWRPPLRGSLQAAVPALRLVALPAERREPLGAAQPRRRAMPAAGPRRERSQGGRPGSWQWRPDGWRPERRARSGRKQPTRGHRHCLEAASGQDSRAGTSGTRRDRLHLYGDDQRKSETGRRTRHWPVDQRYDDSAESGPQPLDRRRARWPRRHAQVLVDYRLP